MVKEVTLSNDELKLIGDLVYAKFGIILNEKKKSLVSGRLQKVLKEKKYTSFREYYEEIISDKTGKALLELVDKLSTNHTYFFRENNHFEFLKEEILPQFINEKEIRIWSAASSSGEEVYTIKMVLEEFFKAAPVRRLLLGTDISTTVLKQASSGIYNADKVSVLPKSYLFEYFNKYDKDRYQVKDRFRDEILFRRLNLMSPSFPFKNKFDVIFCRNVMIYFDEKTKSELSKKFYNYLKPKGYLFIGMSETLGQDNHYFEYLKPSIYQKI